MSIASQTPGTRGPQAEGDKLRSATALPVDLSHLLKPTDVARRLGVSRSWLYEAAKTGRIPHVRLGGPEGPVRFVEADLLAWLAEARAAWRPGRGTPADSLEDAVA